MKLLLWLTRVPALPVTAALLLLAGCTVFPEKKQATLATTTSAEQTQRIFWNDVQAGKWNEVSGLMAPNVAWRVDGHLVERTGIVPWLRASGINSIAVADTQIKSNVNDMTLLYGLQISASGLLSAEGRSPGATAGHTAEPACLQNFRALAVWQQPQPGGSAKASDARYLLTVEDLAVDRSASSAGCAGR